MIWLPGPAYVSGLLYPCHTPLPGIAIIPMSNAGMDITAVVSLWRT